MRDHRNGLAAAVSLLFAIGLATAPIAGADDTCANAKLRAQNNSTALPDCRAYEMVSSRYKEGFPVKEVALRFTDDGVVSYMSFGSFAGNSLPVIYNRYHATRSAVGWVATSVAPPGAIYDTMENPVQRESADLRWSLWQMLRRDVPGDKFGLWLRGPDGAITRIGDTEDDLLGTQAGVAGVSADLSHVVLNYGPTSLYEYVGTGNEPRRTVSVDNHGQPQAPTCFKHISPDGRAIVYTVGCELGTPQSTQQVWARIGGSASVAVSGSECMRTSGDPGGECNDVSAAEYGGAAVDGSRVFFTTSQQLANGDIDQTSDLYACDVPAGIPAPVGAANACEALTQVSGTASGAQVASVPVVSEDGSRAYFVAQGAALADNLGVNGAAAVAGESNLYLWIKDAAHPAGEVRFVAELDANDVGRPQLTPDGRYLLFTTVSALVTSGPGADNDDGDAGGARDVYRYDATTNTMVRLSTSVTGSGGNAPGFDVSMVLGASSMAADGSTVIFDTAEPLSVTDTDGVTDVYGWHDGHVSLISAGGGNSVGITPSGRDIFFVTDAQVLATDGDSLTDIYTARVGGGFDRPQPAPCAGDGCRGPSSNAPSLAGSRSGLSGDGDPGDAAAVLSLRAVTVTQRRRLAATGKVSLTVAANAAGRVSATARAKIGGRSVTVGSGRRTLTTPGSVAVTLKLSRKARSQLAARGRLTVKVVVSHSKASKGRSVTLKLTRARASKSSVGGRS